MADDIVTRLRTVDEFSDAIGIMDAAADEIERLRRLDARRQHEIERLLHENSQLQERTRRDY